MAWRYGSSKIGPREVVGTDGSGGDARTRRVARGIRGTTGL